VNEHYRLTCYRLAQLVDYFHLQLAPCAQDLTLRQIADVYHHRRDKHGKLVAPSPSTPVARKAKAPKSCLEELQQLEPLRGMFQTHDFEKMQEEVKQRWQTGVREYGP
jgi:hypothetical protein